MVRRLPVLQNNSQASPPVLGKVTGTLALVVTAGLCWAVLLWGFAGLGGIAIAATCFLACALAGAAVGSQIERNWRRRLFAQAGAVFAVTVVAVAGLGGTLGSLPVFLAALLMVTALSEAGFFVGGWFLTLRR